MKFFTTIAAASVLATTALATPLPQASDAAPSGSSPFSGQAKGTIDCTVETKKCEVKCGDTLQAVCGLVGVFDSVFYGIEALAGFTVDCTEKGCNVYCPVDGTAICAANEAVATFDSVFAVGETIAIDGIQNLASSLGDLVPIPAPSL